jgi:glucose-1-phosphate thymidylyltransferase
MPHSKRIAETVGLIPAAGKATRLGPLPCSKELLPINFRKESQDRERGPKVVSQYLLESMRIAEISKVYIVLRKGKWDIPSFLGNGNEVAMHLSYLLTDSSLGVPMTLDQGFPFTGQANVAMGFPDILFEPSDAFAHLKEKKKSSNADIILGLFPASRPTKMDLVAFDEAGKVRGIEIKPARSSLVYTWIIALWTPAFSEFMHEYLKSYSEDRLIRGRSKAQGPIKRQEVFMSEVILAAIDQRMDVDSLIFRTGRCLDIGTPDDLLTAVLLANGKPD